MQGGEAVLAKSAFEHRAVIHRSAVISHNFTVVSFPLRILGNRCTTLEQETLFAFIVSAASEL